MILSPADWESALRRIIAKLVPLLFAFILLILTGGGCAPVRNPSDIMGRKISVVPTAKHSGLALMSSSNIAEAYDFTMDGISFTAAVNEDNVVVFLATKDPSFKTPEGVSMGTPLPQVLELSAGGTLRKERGWAYFVTLPSGWNAAFVHGYTMTEDPLPPDSRAVWIFQRKGLRRRDPIGQ